MRDRPPVWAPAVGHVSVVSAANNPPAFGTLSALGARPANGASAAALGGLCLGRRAEGAVVQPHDGA